MFFLPTWLILSILTGFSSNVFNFLNRFILKDRDDPTVYAWYIEIVRFLAFGILAVFDFHIILTPYSIILFVLLGITEFIAAYWYMKMHFHNHLSISTILSRTRLIWVPILAFLFIGEKLSTIDYLSIVVIFLGVSVIMAPHKLFIDKSAMYANLSAFMIACNIVLVKMLIPFGSTAVINIALALPSIFLFPLLMKSSKVRIQKGLQTNMMLKTLAALLSVMQIYLFVLTLKFGDASKINAIYQSTMIFSVLAGIIFLKEKKDIAKKIIGATITLVGVVLLSFS